MSIVHGRRHRVLAIARFGVLLLLAALFLVPFYLLVRNALTDQNLLVRPEWRWWPGELAWGNLTELFDSSASVPMGRALFNSAFVAVAQTVGVVVISAMAGYGFARIEYRYANLIFGLVTATLLIPAAVTFVPSFVLVSKLGWVSTLQGLIVPGLFQALATFLFRQSFLSFPKEIEEAAYVDGLGYFGTFWRIVVPNSYGIMAAVATIIFIGSWNAFLWPLVIGRDQDSWTVQVALSTLLTAQKVEFAQLFMGALVAIVPLLMMFIFLQRWIVQGVERAGLGGE